MKRKYLYTVVAFVALVALLLPSVASGITPAPVYSGQTPLDGSTLTKWDHQLPILDVAGGTIQTIVDNGSEIDIEMREFQSRMLPPSDFPPATYNGTWVWGYVEASTPAGIRDTYTGPVVVATRGQPTQMKFNNELLTGATTNVTAYKYATDQSLHWANPDGVPMYVQPDDEEPEVDWVGNPEHYSGPIPAAVHMHGAEDPAAIDGGPDSWFTNYADPEDNTSSLHGAAYYSMDGDNGQNYSIYRYPNTQEAAPLWFHDHTLGATRLNVYAGLAGAYALIDTELNLPDGLLPIGLDTDGSEDINSNDEYLIPLVVQDRQFDEDGQLYFPAGPPDFSPNPEHLYWSPEFFGDTIAVNGKVWPNLDVQQQRYRFYLINGSNARTYILTFEDTEEVDNPAGSPTIWQIGTDQGYLDSAVEVERLVVMPGERAEFILDFSGLAENDTVILNNLGPDEPFGGGVPGVDFDAADPATTGQVIQFTVGTAPAADNSFDPSDDPEIRTGGQTIVRLVDPENGVLAEDVNVDLTRELTLNEIARDEEITVDGVTYTGGPLEALVNNTKWRGLRPDESDPNEMDLGKLKPVNGGTPDGIGNWLTEMPQEGSTEVWEIVNTTADAHPIHTHLAQFQLLNREAYDEAGFWGVYEAAFPGGAFIPGYGPPLQYGPTNAAGHKYGGNPDVAPFLSGTIEEPNPNEAGWKDTIFAPPGKVTRFVVRWAPQDLPVTAKQKDLHYAFNPNDHIPGGFGAIFDYVWHCHIVDHEDNEMMRPDRVKPRAGIGARDYQMGSDY